MKLNLSKTLLCYCIVYFTYRIFSPISFFNIYFVYLASIILLIIMREKLSVKIIGYLLIPSIIYVTIALFIYYIKDVSFSYWNTFDNYFKIQSMVILCGCLAAFEKKFQKSCVKVAFVGWYLTLISTFINLMIDPDILRSTASNAKVSNIYFGYGGYDYIYGIVIVNCLVLYYLLEKKKNVPRFIPSLLLILFLLISNIVILLSGFLTATILNIIAEALFFIRYIKNPFLKTTIIILAVLSTFELSNIISFLSNTGSISNLTKERLISLIDTVKNGGELTSVSAYNSRIIRVQLSWNMFKEHPLFGNFIMETNVTTGEHTEWIDRLAQYGMIIFSLIIWFWIRCYKFSVREFRKNNLDRSIVRISYLYFLVLGFFNPSTYALTVFPLLFFLPLVNTIFDTGTNPTKKPSTCVVD